MEILGPDRRGGAPRGAVYLDPPGAWVQAAGRVLCPADVSYLCTERMAEGGGVRREQPFSPADPGPPAPGVACARRAGRGGPV